MNEILENLVLQKLSGKFALESVEFAQLSEEAALARLKEFAEMHYFATYKIRASLGGYTICGFDFNAPARKMTTIQEIYEHELIHMQAPSQETPVTDHGIESNRYGWYMTKLPDGPL
jgi:hypothetical protein